MKYEKCITCKQLGNGCDGPNMLMMDTIELGRWCNELRKKRPGMTYDKTASETGVSKTAIYNFLTGAHADCRLETVRPIVKLYVGGDCDDNPCGNVSNSEKAAYEEEIRSLKAGIAWRDDKIQHFEEENDRMRIHVAKTDEEYQKNSVFFKATIKTLRRALAVVSIFLGLAIAVAVVLPIII